MKFFQKLFCPSFCSFFRGFWTNFQHTTRFSSEHDITLYTNVFIASDKIVSAAYLGIRYHTAEKHAFSNDECILYQSGDKNFWRRRRTHFMLETNTLKTHLLTSGTRTASYQRLPNRTCVEMMASHNYSPKTTGAIVLPRSERYTCTVYLHVDARWYLPWH